MDKHLLNLRVLADAAIADYSIIGFQGNEQISRPFEYRIELITDKKPDLSGWIGKLAEFDVYHGSGVQRVFSGRIYEATRIDDTDVGRIVVSIGPAYQAMAYASATHFVQDKTSIEIFEGMTADVTGLVKKISVSPAPPKRGYAVRYDESEIDFLARLLAQDGIMYFFVADRGAGAFRHKMVVTNKPADYVDVEVGKVEFASASEVGHISMLMHRVGAVPRKHKHASFNVNRLDEPFIKGTGASASWGSVYSHEHETIGFEAKQSGDLASRQKAHDERAAQAADQIEGQSNEPTFFAGGRIEIVGAEGIAPKRVVLTSVAHSARDPWMLGDHDTAHYGNSFVAIDAGQAYRPPVDQPHRRAPGPLLGTVQFHGAGAGEIKVDKEWRVPVAIAHARSYEKNGFAPVVWLPVQQQWSHSTHGAQFFPRIGTRVIVDFLYGNPDLPFIAGCIYTPSQAYPFDPAKKVTQSGWRSITEKNGSVTQEFYFEDKKGGEEIKLYTGRDFRREVDQDDWGTVKRDQTLAVKRDRKRKVEGKETVDVTQTRTVTVQQKNLLESKAEIQLKVGSSTITMKPDGIEIKAMKITVNADVKLDMKAGAQASLQSAMTDVKADGMLTLKGGMVMIN